MTFLAENAIKVSLIVLFALAIMPVLRNRAAALRHWILAAAVICAAAAPAMRSVVPSWQVPIAIDASHTIAAARPAVLDPSTQIGGARVHDTTLPFSPTVTGVLLLAIWGGGAAVAATVLIVGFARLFRLQSTAGRIQDGFWVSCADEISRDYNLAPPILLVSAHPSLLVTWGVRQPKVLLPAEALNWSKDRVRLVLAHELAHIRRGDWIVQLTAEILRAFYWFNPFVWIACRRLRQESEQACDDAVINRGVDGSEYATQLVNIARELQYRRTWVPAPSIARTSNLERRVRAMLDARINRRPVSRSVCIAILVAMLAIVIPVTGAAVAQVFASVAGSIVDPMNGALPGVTLVLTNTQTQAKHEVRSDGTGRYEFVGLVPGDYVLEARLPGFATLRGTLTVAGQNVQQDLKLEVGSLEETITVRASISRPEAVNAGPMTSGRPLPKDPPKCGNAGRDGTPIGGNLRPPRKLLDVRPYYPPSAVRAGAEGTVTLESRIGADGTVEEVKVISTPHPDLAAAAADAVRQWVFDPTYLNCVAVPVNMKVTVSFQREP